MKRRDFLKAAGAIGLSTAFCRSRAFGGPVSQRKRKPNFVFILIDDLGWVDTGCYGSKYYETPNIDRLASHGMRFTDGYAACAVCSPTRASILTGRYTPRHGVTDWIHFNDFKGDRSDTNRKHEEGYQGEKSDKLLCPKHHLWMDLEEVTIAEALKGAGYATCHIGKWHLGPDGWYPDKQGFDHNIGGTDMGQPPKYFSPYKIKTLKSGKKDEYLTDREAKEAVKFIEKHKDEPFFLYMAHYAVHTPIEAKKELTEKYRAKKPNQAPEDASKRYENAEYAAMIDSIDQAIGKILTTIDELGLANDTVIFFTSDNGGVGEITDNSPLRQGKSFPYEGGIREPVIVRWKDKIKAGSICSEPVTSVDYFPTMCEMAGVDLPAGRVIDGESILPLLKQTGNLKRDAIFWHYPHYRKTRRFKIPPNSIIRKGDWKLIRFYEPFEGKELNLFNLREDISEKNELSAKRADKVRELNSLLDAWLKQIDAKLPVINPDYEL